MSKKKRSWIRFAILMVIAVAVVYTFIANAQSDNGLVRKGDMAKNFAVTNLANDRFVLAEQEGKGVFINFWGTFCEPCEREMPHIESAYSDYEDQVEMIAINVDEAPLTVQSFVDRHDLSFPIAIDKRRELTRAYGVGPLPATILVDEHGQVQRYHEGEMTEAQIHEFFQSIVPDT